MGRSGHYDDFDQLAIVSGETPAYRLSRSNKTSYGTAREAATVLGPYVPVIEQYLGALSFAPAQHIALFAGRGGRILFAPTIDGALLSSWAERRRGRKLSAAEARRVRIDFGPESDAVAVYDSETDCLIFPTSYRISDLKRAVLHELGHALTVSRAHPRLTLIQGLPTRLNRHVHSERYQGRTATETLRQRVLEALAEGYVYLVDGRSDELPGPLASELVFMLQTVEDGDKVRFEFQTTKHGERTATRGSRRDIIDRDDPEFGSTFADMHLGVDAEAWDLVEDELALRRRRTAA